MSISNIYDALKMAITAADERYARIEKDIAVERKNISDLLAAETLTELDAALLVAAAARLQALVKLEDELAAHIGTLYSIGEPTPRND